MNQISITKLTQNDFVKAVDLVIQANLDTKGEIEHHLKHFDAHWVAKDNDKIIGVIGWYQDNVNYANAAMGDKFPGTDTYWVGFFVVDPNYQHQGIGKKLIQRLEKYLQDNKINELWVSSVPETKTYYEQSGFNEIMTGTISGNQKYFLVKRF
jgi:GNAT superfamily N-acetyltransferase